MIQNAIGFLVEKEKRVSLFATKQDVFVIKQNKASLQVQSFLQKPCWKLDTPAAL